MEEDDKGCLMFRMSVSVSCGTGLPGLSRTKGLKRLCVCVCVCVCVVPITYRTTTSALYVTACSGPNPEVSFQKNSCD